ncbi:hypothetical protein Thermo_00376 [Thermoplasmatales archaeon]|nr:hypothetical protein Thermo_00376 [Thermoplasmatales archaeon]
MNDMRKSSSNLHIVSHPEHTLRGKQILLSFYGSKKSQSSRLSAINRKKKLKELYYPVSDILSGSGREIKHEMIEDRRLMKLAIIALTLTFFGVSVYLYYIYTLYRSPLIILEDIIDFIVFSIISLYIFITRSNENIYKVYICRINLKDLKDEGNPIEIKYTLVDLSYWKHVKKRPGMEPIQMQHGILYIVDKVVLNKFGEPIEVIPE